MNSRIDTAAGRRRLEPSHEPYWNKLTRGKYVGLRKPDTGQCVWYVRYRVSGTAQQYKSLGEMSERFDYDEAKGAAEKWFAELDSGVTGRTKSGGEPTVESACREYVEDRRREKGVRTAQDADKRFERTVYGGGKKNERHRSADVRLEKLRSAHIREWRQSLVDAGLSKASVNRTQISLCAALNLAVTHKMIGIDKASAWRDVKPFKGVSKRRDLFLDLSQRRALLAASKGAVHQLISAVMLTGARGELVSARAKQFDARTQTITVTGKTGTRPIVLSEAAVQFFSKRADQIESNDFLLVRDDGMPWAHSDWDELVRAAAKEAKLPTGVCLYTLRHSWITQALLDGMSTLEVAKLVGTSLMMIEKHYGHLVHSTARERLNAVSMM